MYWHLIWGLVTMFFHWILITRYHHYNESSLILTTGLWNVRWSRNYSTEGLLLVLLNQPHVSCAMGVIDKMKGGMSSMANLRKNVTCTVIAATGTLVLKTSWRRWTSLKFGRISITKIALDLWWNTELTSGLWYVCWSKKYSTEWSRG